MANHVLDVLHATGLYTGYEPMSYSWNSLPVHIVPSALSDICRIIRNNEMRMEVQELQLSMLREELRQLKDKLGAVGSERCAHE